MEAKAFSSQDIINVCGVRNILEYGQLRAINSLNELLGRERAAVILFETREHFGHWVCIHQTGNKTAEFFDPYGLEMDEELKFVPENMRYVLGEATPHLSHIVKKSGWDVVSNKTQLQRFKEHVNTCGRWVSARLRLRKMPLRVFVRVFTSGQPSPDEMVTSYTETILKTS